MSGTEAVMQAVRLARYHTRPHAIWCASAAPITAGGSDVQPGIGNPLPPRETYTLKDMDADSLHVLRTRTRHRLRAGQSAAGPASRMPARPAIPRWSTARAAPHFDRAAYTDWLQAAARGLHASAASC